VRERDVSFFSFFWLSFLLEFSRAAGRPTRRKEGVVEGRCGRGGAVASTEQTHKHKAG
jgi:hypothetical protein